MRKETVGRLWEKIKVLFKTEVDAKLSRMIVDERKDRIRIIFEFEFSEECVKLSLIKKKVIRDAVEIRHRRPWE